MFSEGYLFAAVTLMLSVAPMRRTIAYGLEPRRKKVDMITRLFMVLSLQDLDKSAAHRIIELGMLATLPRRIFKH